MNVSFITWDGPDQNYMESLFFPIFERAGGADLEFSTLQFTWGNQKVRQSVRRAGRRMGIDYEARSVLRRPLKPATALMLARGVFSVVRHARRHNTDVLMPKQIMPAAMCVAAKKFLPGVRLLFDTDGFMADERVDFGGWDREGKVYRLFRAMEAKACREADAVATRTERGKAIIIDRVGPDLDPDRVFAIPNGKDPDEFHPGAADSRMETRQREGIPEDAPWIVYAGSLGPQYHPESIFQLFEEISTSRPDTRMTVLTGHKEKATEIRAQRDIDSSRVDIKRVHPDRVPAFLAAADMGVAFRTPTFSQQGVCPIKIAEYLLCGLPVVCTAGVGDIDDQIDDKVGLVLNAEQLSTTGIKRAAEWFVDDVLEAREQYRSACRQRGLAHFDVERSARLLRDAIRACE